MASRCQTLSGGAYTEASSDIAHDLPDPARVCIHNRKVGREVNDQAMNFGAALHFVNDFVGEGR